MRIVQIIISNFRKASKWRRFAMLVALASVLAALASAVAYRTVLSGAHTLHFTIAVVGPMSGSDRAIGEAMRDAVSIWVSDINRRVLDRNRTVSISVFDEAADPDAAAHAAAAPNVIGAIGPYNPDAARKAAEIWRAAGLPAFSLGDASEAMDPDGKATLLPLAGSSTYEIQFLANYLRNVIGERLISIIMPDTPRAAELATTFDEVLRRFGTRVVYQWAAPAGPGPVRTETLIKMAEGIDQQKIAGTLLVLGEPDFAAETLAVLRAARVTNRVAGTRSLATSGFREALSRYWRGPGSVGTGLNGTLVATPMLFDTAGAAAQNFKTNFGGAFGRSPDWIAALSFDAAQLIGSRLGQAGPLETAPAIRADLAQSLASRQSPQSAFAGIAGPIFFDPHGRSSLPTLMGSYDGPQLISTLTQLSPIRDEGVSNYLRELTSGRALYVNDRFMYKTNVVYSGIRLEKVSNIDTSANTADLEFVVWFRWDGAFDPQDIVFPNAAAPIRLTTPEREEKIGALNYRAYRVTGKFLMNFSDTAHAYGTQLLGISFRHRTLTRNNVMYVADILGMGFSGEHPEKREAQGAWFNQFFRSNADAGELGRQLIETRVLAGVSGWVVDRASLSQRVGPSGTDGDPTYVGFGRPDPEFSFLDLGVIVKPDTIDLHDFVPANLMAYLAIFAFSGATLAFIMDRKGRSYFWRLQTLLLRLICWPVLLMSASALAIDYTLAHASLPVVNLVNMTSNILWFLVPAQLLSICVERFVWIPLEQKTGRKVPTVFRIIAILVIFVGAGFGIVSFVLGKTLTSLLATSGLLAMIIGLAVQSNLKDIFSGIMLNLERPFAINDFIRVNKTVGQVIDVTWRTTRLKTVDGTIVAMPNGKLADAEIENLSRAVKFAVDIPFYVDPGHAPEQVLALVAQALDEVKDIPFTTEAARFRGITNVQGAWAAQYVINLSITKEADRGPLTSAVWGRLWAVMEAAGIAWRPTTKPEDHGALPGSDTLPVRQIKVGA